MENIGKEPAVLSVALCIVRKGIKSSSKIRRKYAAFLGLNCLREQWQNQCNKTLRDWWRALWRWRFSEMPGGTSRSFPIPSVWGPVILKMYMNIKTKFYNTQPHTHTHTHTQIISLYIIWRKGHVNLKAFAHMFPWQPVPYPCRLHLCGMDSGNRAASSLLESCGLIMTVTIPTCLYLLHWISFLWLL